MLCYIIKEMHEGSRLEELLRVDRLFIRFDLLNSLAEAVI